METVLGELRDEVRLVLVSPGSQRAEEKVGSLPEKSRHDWPSELCTSHETVDHPPPVQGQDLQVGGEVGGADAVEDDVDPPPPRPLVDLLPPVLGPVVGPGLGPQAESCGHLTVSAGSHKAAARTRSPGPR